MLEKQLRDVYHEFLVCETTPLKMKCQVLRNLSTYLTEEEAKMIKADHECKYFSHAQFVVLLNVLTILVSQCDNSIS